MPDEDKTFSGSLVLDLRIWWRHVNTLYTAWSCGGSVAEWSARRTRIPAVAGSSPALTTTLICFTAVPNSNPRPRL